jgi:hypothetical protein
MAYGVKYRLDFEDHEGNGKRLDILKNNYTGSILPLVGGAEPVKIKWDGDDDFYSPIIGSTCNISLYQTDETNYDDFFNEPEREYKVEVYTAQAIRDEFKNNVQDDGGIVEAADCLNGSYYDTGTLLQRRVVNDGGNIEAVDCVSAVLTETQDNYTLFWTGWLLSDQFAEVLAPNPQPINLTAIDGLGELDNYFVDNTYYSISFSNLQWDLSSVICKALENVGLGLDVLLNNDIEVLTNIFTGATDNLYTTNIGGNEQVFFSDDYEFFNVKEFLENILKNINARIFQANGRWVVLNNSTYSEEAILDYVKDYKNENDELPDGIGTMRQAYLKGDIERLYFKRFNSSGTYQNEYNYEGLRTIRTDLQPLEQNLTREAERGYKAVSFKTPPVKSIVDYNDDVGFEFQNTTHWTITSGSFVTNEIALKGKRSFKTTATNSGSTPSSLAITGQYGGNRDVAMKLKLNYYYDTNNATQSTTLYNMFWCQIYFQAAVPFYYDVENQNWTTTVKYFFFEDDKSAADTWVSQSLDVEKLPASAGQSQTVYLRIYGPRNYLTNYQGVYIDNVVLFKDRPNTFINERILTQDSTTNVIIEETEIDRSLAAFTLGYTDIYDSSDLFSIKIPKQVTAKQQLNDFRNTVLRYEGTLYNNETAPLTPMDKIRINFTNFSEGDSLLIDGLIYSLKSNKYDIIAHKPNQDGDTAATETTKTETFNTE